MTVKRIVANIATLDAAAVRQFYQDIFELEVAMDLGWIATLSHAHGDDAPVQLSVAREGGSGTAVPALSIEVDDLDAVMARATAAGVQIENGPADEPWGVRRFYFCDPAGTLINVLAHAGSSGRVRPDDFGELL